MFLTPAQAASYLKISEKTLARWAEQGVIPFRRQNNTVLFNQNDIINWAHAKKIGTNTQNVSISQTQVENDFSISDAICRGGVFYDIPGETKEYIFQHLADYFALPNEQIALQLAEQLWAREMLSSTGIGHGIAIPHPRHPNDWGLNGSTIGVFYLKDEINFKSPDRQEVFVLFVLLSSTIKSHLKILSKLSHYLHLQENRDFINQKPNLEELVKHIESHP